MESKLFTMRVKGDKAKILTALYHFHYRRGLRIQKDGETQSATSYLYDNNVIDDVRMSLVYKGIGEELLFLMYYTETKEGLDVLHDLRRLITTIQ